MNYTSLRTKRLYTWLRCCWRGFQITIDILHSLQLAGEGEMPCPHWIKP
jgi:hypothetical protein